MVASCVKIVKSEAIDVMGLSIPDDMIALMQNVAYMRHCLRLHQDHEHKSVVRPSLSGVVAGAKSALRQSQSQLYPHMNTFFHLRLPFRGSEEHACNHTSSRLQIIYIKS